MNEQPTNATPAPQPAESTAKKPYEKPVVKRHGNVRMISQLS